MKNKLPVKYKLFLSLIIFSFIWVIIGDLLSMHMRTIYHVEIQKHSPFTDIHKSVKKVNKSKSNTFKEDFHFFIDFILPDENKKTFYFYNCETIKTQDSQINNSQFLFPYIGRAPPIFV